MTKGLSYVGMDGEIYKALIVETKGEIYVQSSRFFKNKSNNSTDLTKRTR